MNIFRFEATGMTGNVAQWSQTMTVGHERGCVCSARLCGSQRRLNVNAGDGRLTASILGAQEDRGR